jgi:hypothetical protein
LRPSGIILRGVFRSSKHLPLSFYTGFTPPPAPVKERRNGELKCTPRVTYCQVMGVDDLTHIRLTVTCSRCVQWAWLSFAAWSTALRPSFEPNTFAITSRALQKEAKVAVAAVSRSETLCVGCGDCTDCTAEARLAGAASVY